MRLNLADPQHSDIQFSIINFPDGQRLLQLNPPPDVPLQDILLLSRFTSFRDLELIISAVAALRNRAGDQLRITLRLPYILGARSDRRFHPDQPDYLPEVIAPVLNSLHLTRIECCDPHSPVLSKVLNNFHSLPLENFYIQVARAIQPTIIVAPDAGARQRCHNFLTTCTTLGMNPSLLECSKHREISTGKITGLDIPDLDLTGHTLLVVDDICDGGRTFIELARPLRERHSGSLHLVVTHGIFSKGFDELLRLYDSIHCTNSYSDIQHPGVTQFDVYYQDRA